MKLSINIDSDNVAIESRSAVAASLDRIAMKIRSGDEGGKILDENGQSVGSWSIDDESENESGEDE